MTPTGVEFLDHTADVGFDVRADSLERLLHNAAIGMLALLRGDEESTADPDAAAREPDDDMPTATFPIRVHTTGPVQLLLAWLREVHFLHEVRHRDYASLEVDRIDPECLEGRIVTVPGGRAEREIKGVTYHDMEVERDERGEWRARVIFDV